MKKILLIIIIASLTGFSARAQTTYWTEDFSTGDGWTLETNWLCDYGYLTFSAVPVIENFDFSAISPVITLEDRPYGLTVNQFLESFFPAVTTEMAEIYIVTESDEYLIWSWELSNIGWGSPSGTDLTLDISNYANQDIQFKFRTHGPTTDAWYWWNIFYLTLDTYYDNDLTVSNLSGPTFLELNETGEWDIEISNLGINQQGGFTIDLIDYKTGQVIGSIYEPDSIPYGESKSYTISWTPDSSYNTVVSAILQHNDDYTGNNKSNGYFLRIKPENPDISILVWDNSNGIATIVDPEMKDIIGPVDGITRALDKAGFTYDLEYMLPDELYHYDLILTTLGSYCLS